ncbi:septation protein A [Chitinibacter fontanus]|uniref:Inner membrane-spanning protein YciB n=1 Tax=Chitinibacter fontanus TaxID=1737446 RepID=A0A7D5ZKQ4_9NEIS|nr:septation protein A [Chitinibacter fontanus]QLI82070.1 septation protein A [Chitinibacter fontanus]
MKFIFDLFPILLFFGAYSYTDDIYIATGVTIAATIGQVIYSWVRHRHVDNMLWISLVLITVMGGMTIIFHNKQFIMWKPTVLYWLFSVVLVGAWHLKQNNLIEKLMGASLELPRPIWTKLMYAWALFFLLMGALNIYVFHNFSEALWVKFKVFGTLVLTLGFVVAQSVYLSKHMQPEQQDKPADSE